MADLPSNVTVEEHGSGSKVTRGGRSLTIRNHGTSWMPDWWLCTLTGCLLRRVRDREHGVFAARATLAGWEVLRG